MKIKTKTQVTYNDGILSTKSDTITGVINSISIRRNFTMFIIGYSYLDSNGNEIKQDSYILTDIEANDLYDLIKNDLPVDFSDLSQTEQTMYKYYNGFINLMAETFNIDKTDIELIQ